MCEDFLRLKASVREFVVSRLDHKTLNEIEGLENPTSETLARWVCDRLVNGLWTNLRPAWVRVAESDSAWVEYRP